MRSPSPAPACHEYLRAFAGLSARLTPSVGSVATAAFQTADSLEEASLRSFGLRDSGGGCSFGGPGSGPTHSPAAPPGLHPPTCRAMAEPPDSVNAEGLSNRLGRHSAPGGERLSQQRVRSRSPRISRRGQSPAWCCSRPAEAPAQEQGQRIAIRSSTGSFHHSGMRTTALPTNEPSFIARKARGASANGT